jgi:hypothetical protein
MNRDDVKSHIDPRFNGMRVRGGEDFFAKGFTEGELNAAYYQLTAARHDDWMILEAADFTDVDAFYNPGEEAVPEGFILEAVTIESFSRTSKRMMAVQRVLGKHLSDNEMIDPLEPIVGKPKKSGNFAYVTVQLPFTDGQTVSIVFHSPEGDKKKIGPSDQLIAFRWLLNKRDITQVVAPEAGKEVSLEQISKRIAQLVEKNHKRFVSTQKQAVEEKKRLEELTKQAEDAEQQNQELAEQLSELADKAESADLRIQNTQSRIDKQKERNAELEAEIAALQAKRNADSVGGDAGGDDAKYDPESGNPLISVTAEYPTLENRNSWSGAAQDVFHFTAKSAPESFQEMENFMADIAKQAGISKYGRPIVFKDDVAWKGIKGKKYAYVARVTIDGEDGKPAIRLEAKMSPDQVNGGYRTTKRNLNGVDSHNSVKSLIRSVSQKGEPIPISQKAFEDILGASNVTDGGNADGSDTKQEYNNESEAMTAVSNAIKESRQPGFGKFRDPEFVKTINEGVKRGWLNKRSETQIDWTEEGVKAYRELIADNSSANDTPEMEPIENLPEGWEPVKTEIGITYRKTVNDATVGIEVTRRDDGTFNVERVAKGGEERSNHAIAQDEKRAERLALEQMSQVDADFQQGDSDTPDDDDADKPAPAIQPAKEQKGNPAKRIAKLVHNLGIESKIMKPEFYAKVPNDPYLDLVIESHKAPEGDGLLLYFTHYIEEGGDKIIDSEIVMLTYPETGLLKMVEVAGRGPRGEFRSKDNSFANIITKNLIDQGFDKQAVNVIGEGEGQGEGEPEPDTREPKLPEPTSRQDGTADKHIEVEIEDLPAFGKAEILNVGSENIYVKKDGLFYFAKVYSTEKYQPGMYDFANDKPVDEGASANFSPGDTVYFYHEAKGEYVEANYRGPQGDDKAVVVYDGSNWTLGNDELFAEKPAEPSEPEPDTANPAVNAARETLQSIIDGDYDNDPDTLDKLLDQAAETLEEAGVDLDADEQINAAADHAADLAIAAAKEVQ